MAAWRNSSHVSRLNIKYPFFIGVLGISLNIVKQHLKGGVFWICPDKFYACLNSDRRHFWEYINSNWTMGYMRIISRLAGCVAGRRSTATRDARKTNPLGQRTYGRRKILLRICRPQEDLTQDLSAAGRSCSGSVGRRKISLRICRPQEDLAQDLSAAERSHFGQRTHHPGTVPWAQKPVRNTIAKTRKESPIMCYTVKKRREVNRTHHPGYCPFARHEQSTWCDPCPAGPAVSTADMGHG